jgi:hypothetical protein
VSNFDDKVLETFAAAGAKLRLVRQWMLDTSFITAGEPAVARGDETIALKKGALPISFGSDCVHLRSSAVPLLDALRNSSSAVVNQQTRNLLLAHD